MTDVPGSIYESDYLKISGAEEEDLFDISRTRLQRL